MLNSKPNTKKAWETIILIKKKLTNAKHNTSVLWSVKRKTSLMI